jgi:hypothetical protein
MRRSIVPSPRSALLMRRVHCCCPSSAIRSWHSVLNNGRIWMIFSGASPSRSSRSTARLPFWRAPSSVNTSSAGAFAPVFVSESQSGRSGRFRRLTRPEACSAPRRIYAVRFEPRYSMVFSVRDLRFCTQRCGRLSPLITSFSAPSASSGLPSLLSATSTESMCTADSASYAETTTW